jgi:hypothetical protein
MQDRDVFVDCLRGNIPAGFQDDVEYSDSPGGVYKIRMSPGPGYMQVTALIKAKEESSGVVRAARVVYSKSYIKPALYSSLYDPPASPPSSLDIHWGPATMESGTIPNPLLTAGYPRKYSRNGLAGIDMVNDALNTNNKDYWAFLPSSDSRVEGFHPDTSYYKAKAANSHVPTTMATGEIRRFPAGTTPAVASPLGSGVFRSSDNEYNYRFVSLGAGPVGYTFQSSTSVIFFTGDFEHIYIQFSSKTFIQVEAIIAGDGVVNNVYAKAFGPGSGVINAPIPLNAPNDYDNAPLFWNAHFKTTYENPGRCCYTLNKVLLAAMVYGEWHFSSEGTEPTVLYGAFRLETLGSPSGQGTVIYYDEDKAYSMWDTKGIQQVSWDEVTAAW